MKTTQLRSRRLLETLEEARAQVARLQNTVLHLESRSQSVTAGYTLRTGASSAGPTELWAELCDQRQNLVNSQKELTRLVSRLEQWINLLPRPRWRMVLRCRYLEGLDLPATRLALEQASGQSFSMSQIYRLHREALLSAEKLWPLTSIPACGPLAFVPTGSGRFPGSMAATVRPRDAGNAGTGSAGFRT